MIKEYELPLIIINVSEPQLHRSLDTIKTQEYGKFNPIISIDNIAPQSLAFNKANEQAQKKKLNGWVLWIGGDMILYHNTIKKIKEYLEIDPPNENTVEYAFGLEDTFLGENICGCPLRRMDIYSKTIRKNVFRNDFYVRKKLEKQGYEYKRPCKNAYLIGTHFDSPDKFQIFRRFRARGLKARKNPKERDKYFNKLKKLKLENHNNSQYHQALSAFEFGFKKATSVAGHDTTIDEIEFWSWINDEK